MRYITGGKDVNLKKVAHMTKRICLLVDMHAYGQAHVVGMWRSWSNEAALSFHVCYISDAEDTYVPYCEYQTLTQKMVLTLT